MTDGVCVCAEGGGGRGVWLDRGGGWEGVVGGGTPLSPEAPLIKSSLNEPEGEHTHTYEQHTHTVSHTLTFLV